MSLSQLAVALISQAQALPVAKAESPDSDETPPLSQTNAQEKVVISSCHCCEFPKDLIPHLATPNS